ncbi:hypothetical protein SimranZ1_1 [Mycobacterium phage SimranZ1]|nr:hypothetical protein SimranZ1_1 [Mycobacterium phage SimranZ1]
MCDLGVGRFPCLSLARLSGIVAALRFVSVMAMLHARCGSLLIARHWAGLSTMTLAHLIRGRLRLTTLLVLLRPLDWVGLRRMRMGWITARQCVGSVIVRSRLGIVLSRK